MMKSYIPCLSDAMRRVVMVLPCCLRGCCRHFIGAIRKITVAVEGFDGIGIGCTGGQTIIRDQSYITCDLGEGTVTKDPTTLNIPYTSGIIRGGRPGQVDCGSRSTCSR